MIKNKYQNKVQSTDSVEIQEIIKKYYEQLYAHKFDKLDEMK